jgi:dipeptidyl aminopeptidase/acylaminoacyl peptidase
MARRSVLALLLATAAFATPVPKKVEPTPVTAVNATDLRLVKEVGRKVYSLQLGPKPGELTLLDHLKSAEVVDDAEFKPVTGGPAGLKPEYFAASAGGKYRAWFERGTTKFVLEDVAGKKTTEIEVGDRGSGCAFSPDGKTLAVEYYVNGRWGGFSEARLYDPATGKRLHTLEQSGQGGLTPAFSPDGKVLAVGNRNHATRLFDVKTGKVLHVLGREMTQGIAFSPDGSKLAAACVDGKVAVWDVGTGEKLGEAKSSCEELYSVDWGKKGDVLATCGRQGKVELWDAAKLTVVKELDVAFWVIAVRFTADGSRLLTSSAADYGGDKGRKLSVFALTGTLTK